MTEDSFERLLDAALDWQGEESEEHARDLTFELNEQNHLFCLAALLRLWFAHENDIPKQKRLLFMFGALDLEQVKKGLLLSKIRDSLYQPELQHAAIQVTDYLGARELLPDLLSISQKPVGKFTASYLDALIRYWQ